MITHFKRRILASAVTRMAVLHPAAGHSAPAAPVAAAATADTTQMDHISVQATGSGAPVILIPGLASPRAVYDGIVPAIEGTHRVYTVQVNGFGGGDPGKNLAPRSEEHTSELQSLMRISYAVFCLKKKKTQKQPPKPHTPYP